ncbi:MAG: DUF4860 domain-containing protein [Butyrivibrio sp.]|nr:DUF4860 domain-containing protein [Butyrivibrio sp.]
MRQQDRTRHMIDMLFVISLLLLFALSALMLIALGASIYKRSTDIMKNNYDNRTAFAYITEKLRQCDSTGIVELKKINKHDAIVLHSDFEGRDYQTFIYYYDGYLMELLSGEYEDDLLFEAGQKIMRIEDFKVIRLEHDTLQIDIELEDAGTVSFIAAKRSSDRDWET